MGGGISKSLYIPDANGEMVHRTLTARYDPKNDNFTLKLPAYLRGHSPGWSKSGDEPWEPTGSDDVFYGKSPALLFKAVELAGKDYVESLKKRVKIIGYDVDYKIGANVDVDVAWEEKHACHDGTELKINYEVGWKVQIGERTAFHKSESGGYMKEPDQWIEWTEEREAFFRDTEKALATLLLRSRSDSRRFSSRSTRTSAPG